MAETIQTVMVVGAGGNLGRSILDALLADATFTVSVLTRKSSPSVFPTNVKVHRIDDTFPVDELSKAFSGQDAVVSAINPSGNDSQEKMIEVATTVSVKRFIPAEFGGNGKHPRALELLPMFMGKQKIVECLREKEKTGLTWSAVCTGPFFDWGMKRGMLGFDLSARTATICNSGDSLWSTTTLNTIGLGVSRILKNPEDTANQYVFIQSFSTSQNEILAALQKATRGQNWAVTRTNATDLAQRGQAKIRDGNWAGIGDLLLATIFGEDRGNKFSDSEVLANEMLGLPEGKVQEAIDLIVAHQFSPES